MFQKQILFFGNTSFLYLVGADIFICMYICRCVYICIQCKGSIYSLHAAGNVSLYSPPWAPGPAAARGQQASSPTTTCKAMVTSQTSLVCGIKQKMCKTWQLFFWCISYLKNDVSCNLSNILIIQSPFLPSQPGIAHLFLWSLPHKGTLKPHVSVTVLFCFFLLM